MDYISGWCKSKRRLDGVTAIVTGSNTGIGKETVIEFYKRGANVIMACRDIKKANFAKKNIEETNETTNTCGSIIVEKLDLSSLNSVKDFVIRVLKKESNIQVLVNNAGVMMCPEGRTEDGFETHIGTNHLGHALLTLLLLPRLKRSAPSRIVFVSSMLHENRNAMWINPFAKDQALDLKDVNFEKTKYDPLEAYCRSKAANILFAKALSHKLKEERINNVTTYSLHPGVITTEISRHFNSTVWYGTTWIFNNILGWFLKSPKCGAQTTIYCAIDEACAEESGLYYQDCAARECSKFCQNQEVAEEYWDLTLKLLKLQNFNPFGDEDPLPSCF